MPSCSAAPLGLKLLLFSLMLLPEYTAQAGEPTAEELVQAYERYLGILCRATFSVHMRVYSDSPQVPRDGPCVESFIRYYRDGQRTKSVESTTARWYLADGKLQTNKYAVERIFTEKWRLIIGYNETGQRPSGIIATLGVPSDGERPRTDSFSPLVDGNVYNNRPSLSDTLRNSKLSVRKTDLEGRPHWIVEGTGKWGYHALWLDPGRDHLPIRYVQRKRAADWLFDSTLANVPKSMGGPWSEYQLQLDASTITALGGRNFLTGFTCVQQVHRAGGTVNERFVASLTDIRLDPDFSTDPFVPSIAIPDGFPVTVEGQQQIDHEWRGGRIVKRVSEGSVANLADNWFRQGSMLGRGLLLLGLLGAGGLGVVLWSRRRRAAAG